MSRSVRVSVVAACAALAAMLAFSFAGGQIPARVTTDTAEYCATLRERIADMLRARAEPAPRDVSLLSAEGSRLCERGEPRGGILRLRQAIVLMAHAQPTP